MENVIVTSVMTGSSGSETRVTEQVTLNFAKVKFTYTMIDRTGNPVPGGEMSWDIAKNSQAAPPPQFFEMLANAGAEVDGTGITFVSNAGVNISTLPLVKSFADASISNPSETSFTLNLSKDVVFHVTGTFVLEDERPVSGKVDTAEYVYKGKVLYSLSSLDLTLEELARFETDVGSGLRFVFAGDDTITGSAKRDYLAGFSGEDTIKAGNGDDRVSGGSGDDALFGGYGRDNLDGGQGQDTVSGGHGKDLLKGGLGDDTFLFENTPRTASGYDRIIDFKVADDEIALDKGVFKALGNAVSASEFHVVKKMSAVEADDRLIYNVNTGLLYYDVDGSEAAKAQVIAKLHPRLALSIDNFDIV
jgi:Ca2+-binding RTX toxin-like protein